MEVDFKSHLQETIKQKVSNLTEIQRLFIKSEYQQTESGNYVLYTFKIQSISYSTMVKSIIKKGIGFKDNRIGHVISQQEFNLISNII